ncbi:EamA-like transporter family protein [Limnobacter thiooxidans]|uniref:DMT family transporter n=1 Tax=Limnobacter thiooxidans TaxID=131080 RepID=A0AA86J509_9BURK|nr:DMT family transporter [Limnobacter sp.]MCZ8016013.1 DMT family transporter [Limnobacter sp.]RZS40153.1 EamA-like transporter family protein [Limnobacter thiooxidans]BET27414.1 DMT family transporter [Limnobacter thiooxidans]
MPDFGKRALPHLALVLNALVWGLSWWPLRELQAEGLHPLWSSSATYLLGAIVLLCAMPQVLAEFLKYKPLWLLALAAGTTMVGFNWGVSIGEVIRVVLLFYLMPIWSVLLARVVLNEAITLSAMLRVGLAFAGAVLVLSPEGALGFPVPSNMAEWLGLMGGAAFALNNILLRHQAERSAQARLFAMFVGGVVAPTAVAIVVAAWLGEGNSIVQWPVVPGSYGVFVLLAFAVTLLLANYGLQYGASRLPANVTSVVMLSEVVFATLSAIVLTDEVLTLQVGVGGSMILVAAALSALNSNSAH